METYGEDPYLTGRIAVQFIRGLQGSDPRCLKVVATAKHYAVHSGPEPDRHTFDAVVDERDLRDTYLPHFEAAIKEGGAWSVMCAYNRFRGDACCGSPLLLATILRNEWGFQRIALRPREKRRVTFTLTPRQMSVLGEEMKPLVEPGVFEVSVGGKQPGFRGLADTPTSGCLTARVEVAAR